MQKKLTFFLATLLVLSIPAFALAAKPVLFFSDLTSGPNTGWAGSSAMGVAVSILGENFGGAIRGTNYVTVNGAQLDSNSNYAEWDTSGTANGIPRGLERITFWVPSNAASGAGNITVTINGVTSNALPFTVRQGNIYFISVADGKDSYSGKLTASNGTDGPWKDIYMIAANNNPIIRPGDTIYVRGGTYTTLDPSNQGMFVDFRNVANVSGTASAPYAVASYPGEIAELNGSNANRGFTYVDSGSPFYVNYWTFSKFLYVNGYNAFNLTGNYNRVVGNHFQNLLNSDWSGVVWATDAQHTSIDGNYFDHCGYDKYKHDIYIKTQNTYGGSGDIAVQNTDIGWNEFYNTVSSNGYGGVVLVSHSGDSNVAGLVTDYTYIHDNYFHAGNEGDFLYLGDGSAPNNSVDNTYVYNNIFSGGTASSNGGVSIDSGVAHLYFYNNTFYQIASANLPVFDYFGSGTTLSSVNNIYYNYSGQTIFNSGGWWTSGYDLFFNSGTPSGAANALNANPQFVSPGSDFHLQSSSPAINAGTTIALVATDYDAIPRPQGTAYCRGAYEYPSGSGSGGGGTTTTEIPSAPTNLTVQ